MRSLPRSSPPDEAREEEVKRLIGEIAKRHNILVPSNDPLFVVVSALELVIGRYLERTDAMLQAQREACLAASERHAANAKAVGEHIVTAAGDYAVKLLRGAAQEITEAIRRSASAELAKINASSKEARRLLWLGAFVSAVGVSVALGLAIGAVLTLHHL
jgi:hypothetical protein